VKYWLVKSEPVKYPIEKFATDGQTFWDGVRNYQARIHLNAMAIGDLALFYHSNEGKEIVGLGRVVKTAYPDHTAEEEGWVMVDLAYEETFPQTVTLAELKAHPVLSQMQLVRNSRLSVSPVTPEEFDLVIRLTHPA
jgi:predicted RNA-binding protein with PUA-like domain